MMFSRLRHVGPTRRFFARTDRSAGGCGSVPEGLDRNSKRFREAPPGITDNNMKILYNATRCFEDFFLLFCTIQESIVQCLQKMRR